MSKYYKLHEVIAMIEDDEECIAADIFITPPVGPIQSDEDSGDEGKMSLDNLTHRQLESLTEATAQRCGQNEFDSLVMMMLLLMYKLGLLVVSQSRMKTVYHQLLSHNQKSR